MRARVQFELPTPGFIRMTDPQFQPTRITPTPEQLAIQLGKYRRCIVSAHAGTAKTTSLALRIGQALERMRVRPATGNTPTGILALTYTAPGVIAMKKKLEEVGLNAESRSRITVLSFEEFSRRELQKFEESKVQYHKTLNPIRPSLESALRCVLENPDEPHRENLPPCLFDLSVMEGLLIDFQRLKGSLFFEQENHPTLSPAYADSVGEDYATLKILRAYEHLRRRQGLDEEAAAFRFEGDATYDLAMRLLTHESIATPLRADLCLLVVDEMHDMNRAMFTLLKGLIQANPRAAFLGVGDPDQVLHNVAGAHAEFMGETFEREIGPFAKLQLTGSLRAGRALTQAAGAMARKDSFESLRNFNSSLIIWPCEDNRQELDFISNAIQTRAGLGSKSTLSQIAIVLRHTSQSVPLEARFLSRGISYETQGFESFLFRPEILFMRGWLAYAQGGMDSMEPSTRRRVLQACLILTKAHVEAEGITDANHSQREVSTLDSIANDAGLSLTFLQNQVLRNADPSIRRRIEAALKCLPPDATHQHMKAFLQRLEPENIFHQTMVLGVDIEQALANTQSFLDPRGFMASFDSILAFVRGVNELDLIRNQIQGRRDSRAVQILTIEAAKGLEFEHVIIPGVNRQHYSPSTHENVDCANLLYVGMTRAKNQLSILFDPEQPSAYLQRLDKLAVGNPALAA